MLPRPEHLLEQRPRDVPQPSTRATPTRATFGGPNWRPGAGSGARHLWRPPKRCPCSGLPFNPPTTGVAALHRSRAQKLWSAAPSPGVWLHAASLLSSPCTTGWHAPDPPV